MIENIAPKVRHEQIVKAVVVIISNAACLSPTRVVQASLACHLGKGSVLVVVEQITGRLQIALRRVQSGAVDQKNIQPPVVVIIKKCNASAHLLEKILFVVRTAGIVSCVRKARGFRDVGENGWARNSR